MIAKGFTEPTERIKRLKKAFVAAVPEVESERVPFYIFLRKDIHCRLRTDRFPLPVHTRFLLLPYGTANGIPFR